MKLTHLTTSARKFMFCGLSTTLSAAIVGLLAINPAAHAALQYDQDVTSNVIFGSGNLNGSFTTDRANGVELGLRAKLRHGPTGAPANIFNSNGNGTYTFDPGVAPTQPPPTAVWSFEWSINSNFDGTTDWNLANLTYVLTMTSSTGAQIAGFDPIHSLNPATSAVQWDHAIGTNLTGNGGGSFIPNNTSNAAGYQSLIGGNNLAQNSWKPHWYATSFDPEIPGTYTFTLTAFDGTTMVASTAMTVITPEPAALSLLAFGGLALLRRRRMVSN
jgi:hypothetical protein